MVEFRKRPSHLIMISLLLLLLFLFFIIYYCNASTASSPSSLSSSYFSKNYNNNNPTTKPHFYGFFPKRTIPIPSSTPSRKHNDIGFQTWPSSP
uniref:Uncharacterized protein n=1 Tax=Cucumis sativus TaxID=3659 RepID=A0A0A0LK15_CUCSA